MRHTPNVVIVTDYRLPQVEYYEAVCNNCQTHFYPLRSDALYCSNRCTVASFRKRQAEIANQELNKQVLIIAKNQEKPAWKDLVLKCRTIMDKYKL